jgi:hypothetical protein
MFEDLANTCAFMTMNIVITLTLAKTCKLPLYMFQLIEVRNIYKDLYDGNILELKYNQSTVHHQQSVLGRKVNANSMY